MLTFPQPHLRPKADRLLLGLPGVQAFSKGEEQNAGNEQAVMQPLRPPAVGFQKRIDHEYFKGNEQGGKQQNADCHGPGTEQPQRALAQQATLQKVNRHPFVWLDLNEFAEDVFGFVVFLQLIQRSRFLEQGARKQVFSSPAVNVVHDERFQQVVAHHQMLAVVTRFK